MLKKLWKPLVLIGISYLLLKFELFGEEKNTDFIQLIFTASTIILGFIYTNFTLLLSYISSDIVKSINFDLIIERNSIIKEGIFYSSICIISSLVYIFSFEKGILISFFNIFQSVALSSFILEFYMFIYSIYKMNSLVSGDLIQKKNKNSRPKQEALLRNNE